MERQDFAAWQQQTFEQVQARMRANYPEWEVPCPGSRLRLEDDVTANNRVYRVMWGEQDARSFSGFYFDVTGMPMRETVDSDAITDRAPLDVQDEPMPVWPPAEDGG